jgi:glutamate-1-semialdehyde 2,1-aminomutase
LKSAALFDRARQVLPGGVSRNTLLYGGPLLYAHHGKGCRVVDVDGVERIDFANNVASHIHGHAFEPIVRAVGEQLQRGTAFTMATEAEVRFAEHLCGRSPAFEKIRFLNSGTEAVMAGMKAARAFTGRSKMAKIEGCYHGAYDYAEVSQAPDPENWGSLDRPSAVPLARGTPDGLVADVVILPFNEAAKAVAVLDAHKDDIAGVIVDPIPHRVGLVPVSANFVEALRDWTSANNALLMFDEVITFRTEVGGMQSRFDVRPDLTAMGKLIGGGFPVGALAGSDEVMDVFAQGDNGLRLPLSGTFSANPITMTAGNAALIHYGEAEVTRLNALAEDARNGLREAIRIADVAASITGDGSLLRIHLMPDAPNNYREAYLSPEEKRALDALIATLYENGVMMIHTGAAALSTPMKQAEIDRLCESVCTALVSIRPLLANPD